MTEPSINAYDYERQEWVSGLPALRLRIAQSQQTLDAVERDLLPPDWYCGQYRDVVRRDLEREVADLERQLTEWGGE